MSEDLQRLDNPPPLPPRPEHGHKGLFGRVLVVGGSADMIGAPALAGLAALRMGAGLVQVAAPRGILAHCLTIAPELIGLGLGQGSEKDRLLRAAEAADAVVIGPGMGRSSEAAGRLHRLIQLDKPMIIDADALNLLALQEKWPGHFRARAVLTPHPGEMTRLARLLGRDSTPADEEGRVGIAVQAARAFAQVVVLKGDGTVVTDGRRLYINRTGDSTLSKAGTGDVLDGMIGCLLAQGMGPMEAAMAGVHLHGVAGELAGARLGRRCALARDVIDALPQALAAG
jgi:ADP-dependent NAD(P)H-hydrate dehydratase